MHRGGHPDAGPWFRLLDRDRRLLSLLAEHKVLTTDQIASVEFASIRRAQDRLRRRALLQRAGGRREPVVGRFPRTAVTSRRPASRGFVPRPQRKGRRMSADR
ncbi:hypothetical protein D5S18_29615 [Nocardia panacis]|uniref:Uncharacterized protein n=1 Tax=Nocardia panacis TaxID=2340916 RepID=A0A3A4KCK0_9NOCA|nr:hypothetical protein D5S18_29615 [Nocardia panacis]